jgi:hypothetical protein
MPRTPPAEPELRAGELGAEVLATDLVFIGAIIFSNDGRWA